MSASARHPTPAARLLALVAALLACGLFFAFGSWQVQRLGWKLALIERVEQRVHAPAVAAPGPAQWPRLNAADDEYRHVQATGTWRHEAETLVQASTELGAGFWVLTPLRRADGSLVLVNRGFVPPAQRAPADHAALGQDERATVSGLLRITEPGGGFLRRNDAAAERWYSRDVPAIAAARHLQNVAPYFIDAEAPPRGAAASAASAWPVGGLTVVSFHNNHLVYAVTWYTLALMAGWAAWRVFRDAPSRRADGLPGVDRN
ncbi:MAG TPA: SURF1 family protein [Rhizobacter sp.]|nr:SURF1 family protein [Rhizobacter sp.]